MSSHEILKQIGERREARHCFIKWWRKEEDWLDFDLLERFMENVSAGEEIGGFELLDMEEMWDQLQRVCGDKVAKSQQAGEELLVWKRDGKEVTCPFTPKALIEVFDVETKGSYVD